MDGYEVLSLILGWIYFFAWSISFYGQIWENYKRKSVSGLSFDFEVYNFIGFLAYSIYTVWGYINPDIASGTFQINDIVFALHALVATIITIVQIFIYYDKTDEYQKVSNTCILIVSLLIWGTLNIIFVEDILHLYPPNLKINDTHFNVVIYLGFQKVFISFIKYMPQVRSNYLRKSTEGWSILNIILDFVGGSFSFAQNLVDTFAGSYSIIKPGQNNSLNVAKFALSICSMFFDIIFLIQHFYLYNNTGNTNRDLLINAHDAEETSTPPSLTKNI